MKADADWQYWPEKQASFEVSVGNGNRIYSSVVLDQLKQLPDSTFNFDQLELDYFKDVYLNLFHNIEIVNGLFIKAGVSVHWRYLINNSKSFLKSRCLIRIGLHCEVSDQNTIVLHLVYVLNGLPVCIIT